MKLDNTFATPELIARWIKAGRIKLAKSLPKDHPPRSDDQAYHAWYRKNRKR